MLFAVGLDPDVATVFVQSHVTEHTQLAWVMECNVSYGELSRMTQFKDKSAKRDGEFISGGLFTYPALQAADILLYDTDEVPGRRRPAPARRDHPRHRHALQPPLRRDVRASPRRSTPTAGARVMDLQDPTSKMSKSTDTDAGLIQLLDDPDVIVRKFKRAVTDSENEVRFDPASQARASATCCEILGARHRPHARRRSPSGYTQYGPLKADAGDAVVELLRPIQARYRELLDDPGRAGRAAAQAAPTRPAPSPRSTLQRAYDAIGFLPR